MEYENLLDISIRLAGFVKMLIGENRELRALLDQETDLKHDAINEKIDLILESNRLIAAILIEKGEQQ